MFPSRRFQIEKLMPLPRAAVWQVLSHTERLNRSIGLAPVQYGELQAEADGIYRPASARVAGMKMEWREYPFEWENEMRHCVVRVYKKGPIARFEGGIELEDGEANQTLLRVFSDITPNGAAGAAIVPLIAKRFLDQTLDYCDQIFSAPVRPDFSSPDAECSPQPSAPRPKPADVNGPLLRRLLKGLTERGVNEKLALEIGNFLHHAGDDAVSAIRPFEWARLRRFNRNDVLKAYLHGVKVGLFNLRWATMCPNCRVSKTEVSSLQNLPDSVHCDLCGVAYDLNFDRYIELRFAVHPAVRRADSHIYCLGGPFRAPHILIQKRIGVGEQQTLTIPPQGSELRMRTLRSNRTLIFEDGASETTQLLFTPTGWSDGAHHLPRIAFPRTGKIEVSNDTAETLWVVVEKTQWDDLAATAAQVTAMQEFRDLFSSEVLRPGRQVAVENVTLFFSDLSNSTALYERIGDAPAFGRVGNHFDFLGEHIAAHGGAVVKTMGDAVMAVFHRSENAFSAALSIQAHFKTFRDTISDNGDVEIKIGLHSGPALVVGRGGTMDYFGRTVNIAARVAAKAGGGDIVFTKALWENDLVRDLAFDSGAKLTSFGAELRGLDEQFDLIRARV